MGERREMGEKEQEGERRDRVGEGRGSERGIKGRKRWGVGRKRRESRDGRGEIGTR